MVVDALSTAGILLDNASSVQEKTLADVPPAVVYNMVSNLHIIQDPRIISLLRKRPLPEEFLGWPTDPPPPGLFLLMVDDHPDVRHWARGRSSKCKVVPIARNKFIGPFMGAIGAVANALTGHCDSSVHSNTTPPLNFNECTSTFSHSFTVDRVQLWAGFLAILRLVPVECLTSNTEARIDLRRIVIGHLHRVGPGQLFSFPA